MLITFKSRAGADVIMFGDVAKQMLAVIGKDPEDTRGIVTTVQLPAALEALRAAVERDKLERASASNEEDETDDEQAPRPKDARISFAQRAIPLMELMSHALREETHVIWEA